MHFRVRRMLDLDRDTLVRLKGLTNDKVRGDLTDDGSASGSVFRERISEHLAGFERFPEKSWAILAWDGLFLAGWSLLVCHEVGPDHVPFSVPTGAVGLYVQPDWRRSGLGKCLIEEASEVARKNGMRRLLANPWNSRSHSFFESVGFIDVSPFVPGWARGVAVLEL
jgi:GNAT superfamily N-acetyltransferase